MKENLLGGFFMSLDAPIGVFDSGVGGLTVAREGFHMVASQKKLLFPFPDRLQSSY